MTTNCLPLQRKSKPSLLKRASLWPPSPTLPLPRCPLGSRQGWVELPRSSSMRFQTMLVNRGGRFRAPSLKGIEIRLMDLTELFWYINPLMTLLKAGGLAIACSLSQHHCIKFSAGNSNSIQNPAGRRSHLLHTLPRLGPRLRRDKGQHVPVASIQRGTTPWPWGLSGW